MAAAIGPCMFVAPLVFVLALLAIPLWPVAIVVLSALWLVAWPLEHLALLFGLRGMRGASAKVGKWWRFIVAPWKLFDPPKRPRPPPDGGAQGTP